MAEFSKIIPAAIVGGCIGYLAFGASEETGAPDEFQAGSSITAKEYGQAKTSTATLDGLIEKHGEPLERTEQEDGSGYRAECVIYARKGGDGEFIFCSDNADGGEYDGVLSSKGTL